MNRVSIIIPTLNEEYNLVKQQTTITTLLNDGHEVIVVDGNSQDTTVELAKKIGCKAIVTKASRGHQLHLGALQSKHNILLFLHADTLLPEHALDLIHQSLELEQKAWGRFNINFSSPKFIFKVLAWFMNMRTYLTCIVTGDHAIFVKKEAYLKCGGFPDSIIMEDIVLSKRLKRLSSPICISKCVTTSSRKWEHQGIIKTVVTMWCLRLMFFFGMPAERLAKIYY